MIIIYCWLKLCCLLKFGVTISFSYEEKNNTITKSKCGRKQQQQKTVTKQALLGGKCSVDNLETVHLFS